MKATVTYVTFAPIAKLDGRLTSNAASVRYRVLLPAQQLARRGFKIDVRTTPKTGWPEDAADSIRSDTVVFSKSFHPSNEDLAEDLKYAGAQVVLDVCDNHFEHPEYGPHYHRMVEIADRVIASTDRMAQIIEHHTGRKASVISDPLENPRGQPAFLPRFPAVRLLWFGHPTNLDSLFGALPRLAEAGRRYPIHLRVVTSPIPGLAEKLGAVNGQHHAAFQIELTPWSPQAVRDATAECDIVIIPSLSNDRKSVKSPNRLIESIWAGRCVVANPIPSYEPFGQHCWLGDDLAEGIFWAVGNPEEVVGRITDGQRALAYDHSAYAISRQWEAVIAETVDEPLRLNLGCGDKILPDYVNVDIVESRKGQRPDIMTSVDDLSMFASNSVDEVLAVHVVEHFWRWETLEILKEWVRILKPGGRMILECPNLKSACERFLQDPVRFSRQDQEGQRTMWVFYGDPAWKDPYMIHRWGFIPESLGRLMEEAGLVDVRQEPAQFKLREPRDMRITGIKPSI
jgi:SAM-dependent methyltransferase